MANESKLPGDPVGGMFGLAPAVRDIDNGKAKPAESDSRSEAVEKLAAALLAAKNRKPKPGRPRADWRTSLAPAVAQLMAQFPNHKIPELAREFKAAVEERNKTAESNLRLPSPRTLENWFSDIRTGKHFGSLLGGATRAHKNST